MTYGARPALRIRGAYETGAPEACLVSTKTAKRLKYLRDQWFGNDLHRVYLDPVSGEVFALPVEGSPEKK